MQTPTTEVSSAARRAAYHIAGKPMPGNQPKLSYKDFAAKRLKIITKQQQLVPFNYNPIQEHLMTHLTGKDIILKPRQVGISTAIQGMTYQVSVTSTAFTMTLAQDDDHTMGFRLMADRFYDNDPKHPKRSASNAKMSSYPEFDSHALIFTAGKKTSGRSTTLSHLHATECAFYADLKTIVTGAGEAGNPHIILESTPNGAQGYFYELCMEAKDGQSNWTLHFYPWWADKSYRIGLEKGEVLDYTNEEKELIKQHKLTPEQIKFRRSKQKDLGYLFPQEYAEDPVSCFLTSGLGYFGDLAGVFTISQHMTPQANHFYVAGLDFGQSVDFTALCILDITANCQVDLLRVNRMPWELMRKQIVSKCQHWGVKVLIAEANSMGTTNIEALRAEFANTRNLSGDKKPAPNVLAFMTTNKSKAEIMVGLGNSLHEGGLKLFDNLIAPEQRHELSAFKSEQNINGAWTLSAPDGEHDDTVIALALANYARFRPAWNASSF